LQFAAISVIVNIAWPLTNKGLLTYLLEMLRDSAAVQHR